jgi:integrase
MGYLAAGAIVRVDAAVGMIHAEGVVIPPRPSDIQQVPPSLPASGIPFQQFRPGDPLYETAQDALKFKDVSKAEETKRAYRSDFRQFVEWCGRMGLDPLPATTSTIGLYITDLAKGGAKVSTINRKLASISYWHKDKGLPSPCSMKVDRQLAEVYAGIRRDLGTKQEGKEAISIKLIRRMVETVEGTLTASRDRALILIGFAGGLRRSELAGIEFEHLFWHSRGITVTIPRSKTDQEGEGREVEIARGSQPENTPLSECTCPVRALEQWLRQANIKSGPVFRKVERGENIQKAGLNPASVAFILKRALTRAGVRDIKRFGAHSLRAGFATTAFDNGVPEFKIRQQTGHKTTRMLEKYIRSAQKARQEAASSLGL